jgi:very-short-patch-repair endonuclease
MSDLTKKLRANATAPERRIWRLLHPFRTNGFHFRKQVAIGTYIVDFACLHAQLVIEVDGDSHFTGAALRNNELRDDYLRARGFNVLRFTNRDVMSNSEGIYIVIANALSRRQPSRRSVDAQPIEINP